MRPVNDLFSTAEACLISDAIDAFEVQKKDSGEVYSAEAIVDDVQAAVRDVHVNGVLHDIVMSDFPKYVKPSKNILKMLKYLKSSGKQLFLCTNSSYKFASRALSYVINSSIAEYEQNKHSSVDKVQEGQEIGVIHPTAGAEYRWQELFDVVICSAKKPEFYSSNRNFRKWNIGN